MPAFEVVKDEPEEKTPESSEFASLILERMLGLKALSQRFAIALADLFSLATVGTVFWLALVIIPYQPSAYQLTGLGGYALFIIAANLIARRDK